MPFTPYIAELDDIADQLQSGGNTRAAAKLDLVSNSLSVKSEKLQTLARKKAKRKAVSNGDLVHRGGEDMNPGSEDADEAGRSDAFEADTYHKVPVGQDSMSRYLDAPSPADILDRLDIAEEGEVNIQASRRKAEDVELDEGDAMDSFSTSGLPETGDEDQQPPVDDNQEGEKLEFFGNEPAGALHGGGTGGGSKEARRARAARSILRRTAEVNVEDPSTLHRSESGADVERDQSLGGKGQGSGGSDDGSLEVDVDGDSETANVEFAGKTSSRRRRSRKASKRPIRTRRRRS